MTSLHRCDTWYYINIEKSSVPRVQTLRIDYPIDQQSHLINGERLQHFPILFAKNAPHFLSLRQTQNSPANETSFARKSSFFPTKKPYEHTGSPPFPATPDVQGMSGPQIRTACDCSGIARLEVIREKIVSGTEKGSGIWDNSSSFSPSLVSLCRRVEVVNSQSFVRFPTFVSIHRYRYIDLTRRNVPRQLPST